MKEFPRPKTEYQVFKRYLHVLALLQNNRDQQDWNGTTLADKLSLDEHEPVSQKAARDYIQNHLKDMGFDIKTEKGSRNAELVSELDPEMQLSIARLYSSFVIDNYVLDKTLVKLIEKHPHSALWLMARLYFATLETKEISFDYTANSGKRLNKITINPYHLVIRNNNMYLVGKIKGKDAPWLFILNRIENLIVSTQTFTENIPPVEEIFKGSLGSFIGKSHEVSLRYKKDIALQMDEVLTDLDPVFCEPDSQGWCTGTIEVSDDRYLCKQLLLYGNKIELLGPPQVRETMKMMLQESLAVYS